MSACNDQSPEQELTKPVQTVLTDQGAGSWTIASRTLPAPTGASDALRESIAGAPQPNIEQHAQTTFTTVEEWNRFISATDAGNAQATEALAERWSVTITEDEIAGVTTYHVTPSEINPAFENRLFVHTHGGAYVLGAGLAAAREAVLIAHTAGIPVVSIDYRMPPEHPFPAAIDDVVAVWRSLLQDRPAKSLALGGSSAGGNLALVSTMTFRELGLDLPGAVFAGTPWGDLTKTGDSQFTNEGIDRLLVTYDGLLEGAANLYADGRDLKTPLISPVYGDFTNFPPTILFTGTRDLFLSDTVRVHRKIREAGIEADLHVFEAISHGGWGSPDLPELQTFGDELREFLQQHLQ